MEYTRVDDPAVARWLAERLTEFNGTVANVLPTGFAAYARILHPAYLHDAPVPWRDVAAANGRTAHPLMQWDRIVGVRGVAEQPGVWDEEPDTGNVPQLLVRRLAEVLGNHTGTPERCWFGTWDGWGDAPAGLGDTAQFDIADRRMLLLTGPLDIVHQTSLHGDPPWDLDDPSVVVLVATGPNPPDEEEPPPSDRDPFWWAPNLWWPDDRAWCVATDIDLPYTYLGGTRACIDAVLAADGIEAYPASPDDLVTYDSDHVNPRPSPRPKGS